MVQFTLSVLGNGGGLVETHQGGQHGGAALWSEFAMYGTPIGATFNLVGAQEYDVGYHPSVAVDPNYYVTSTPQSSTPQAAITTVVEVHQAAAGISDLSYHVGTLAIWYEAEPSSLTWGPSHPLNSATGSFASVTVCNGEVIEVQEGASGVLLYTVGTVSGNLINGNSTLPYDKGYHPSIAGDCSYLVEAHQADTPAAGHPTGLYYHAATFPTASSGMDFGPSKKYDLGCSPSVGFAYSNYGNDFTGGPPGYPEYILETHTGVCGETAPLYYDYGFLKP